MAVAETITMNNERAALDRLARLEDVVEHLARAVQYQQDAIATLTEETEGVGEAVNGLSSALADLIDVIRAQ